jgi:aldehyde dehydrogenase (NAD+)
MLFTHIIGRQHMRQIPQNYINGAWVDSIGGTRHQVINPATEAACTEITLGTKADVDAAVAAAKAAFPAFAATTVAQRLDLLGKVLAAYQSRMGDIADAITMEMGAPTSLSKAAQAMTGLGHLATTIETLKNFHFSESVGANEVVYEPIGVVAMITPWNWPINQIAAKVAPCLAAGCTMVLKPSEETPLNAFIFAEILHAAGVPAGVFNLVQGDGPGVGEALSSHPDVDMVSFTGSTRAGISVAKNAADTVKRVHQELGGKSPNIILADADLESAVTGGIKGVMMNTGQSCNAPTRMLVPAALHDKAVAIAAAVANGTHAGDPTQEGPHIGPVVNKRQWDKIQGLIETGIKEGATLAAGGPGRPDGLTTGYYVRPTIFANVTNEMTVAREEIFGPVVCIMPYETEEEAIRIANDTPYGLAAYVSGEPKHAASLVSKLRAGSIHLNGAGMDFSSPFGGFKQSGNGREFGKYGLQEFLETKSVLGKAA